MINECSPQEGTTHVVYASGRGPLTRIEGLRLKDQPATGFQRVQLLRTMQPLPRVDKSIQTIEILTENNTVPSHETTYWCRTHKLPEMFDRKLHVIQYESQIHPATQGIVHHMEVFHCEVDANNELPAWSGSCTDSAMPDVLKACKRVIAAWAYGAGVCCSHHAQTILINHIF